MSNYKKNIIANYIGSILSAITGLISVPIYIYYLGIESFGLIGLYFTLQATMAIFDLGLSPTLNREMAQFKAKKIDSHGIRELLLSLEILFVFVCISLVFITSLLAPFISDHWLQTEELSKHVVSESLIIIMVVLCLRLSSTLYRNAITGLQEQVWLNTNNVIFSILRGPGIAIYFEVSNSVSILSFFMYQTGIGVIEIAILSLKTRKLLPQTIKKVRFCFQSIKNIFRFASGTAGSTALSIMLNQADKIILSGTISLKLFAYYTLASTIANVLYMLASPITTSALPRFTELVSENSIPELADSYRKSSQLISLIVIPVALVICVFSENILILWTQDSTISQQTKTLLSLLVIGTTLQAMMHTPTMLQYANGWTTLMLPINFFMLILAVPSLIFGIQKFGVIFAPIVWIFVNLLPILIAVPIMHRRILPKERNGWYKHCLFIPLISVSVVLFLVHQLLPKPTEYNISVTLLSLFFASCISFIVASFSIPLGRRIFGDLKKQFLTFR